MTMEQARRRNASTETERASVVVAAFTVLSRGTGLVRVLMVGAVLGPTALGNSYQLTNTLPNLIWYGFLAGSLVSSILVPVLVRHLQGHDPDGASRVGRAFLGIALLSGLVVVPIGVVAVPLLLEAATLGVPGTVSEEQVRFVRFLVLLTAPQVLLYAVVGTANAVLHAHRRFALAAAGPSVENLGVILVLVLVATGGGGGDPSSTAPTDALLVLLGAGSTAAVGLNAVLQWWGARRVGVVLTPGGGWRHHEVVEVIRRASRSVACAGLLAVQTLAILLLASRVSGGTVALQISLNFYALPIALITTPVGLALLPELSRAWQSRDLSDYRTRCVRGLNAALFLAVPAAVAYVLLAAPLAHAVATGRMSGGGAEGMIAGSLAALAVGLVGQACFFVTMQAAYAADDTRTPLQCMAVQAICCLGLSAAAALAVEPRSLVTALAVCYAVSTLVGGGILLFRVPGRWPESFPLLLPAVIRTAVAVLVMAVVVELVEAGLAGWGPGRDSLVLLVAGGCGALAFLGVARLLRAPELHWWVAGLRRRGTDRVSTGAAS
jgi:putative peptidoglycan lipid II flippase